METTGVRWGVGPGGVLGGRLGVVHPGYTRPGAGLQQPRQRRAGRGVRRGRVKSVLNDSTTQSFPES